ncbi:MAG: hypothetical protein B5M48_02615 [Candidatus Omnitrophica bacterium 4484_213]|nr:MAG: hypothetical protein B5M48_02615 [Candidatus Omnitrophica bacterium 4484_213]
MNDKEKIAEILKKCNSFLIGSHVNPDGDSLGTELALASLLKRMGKKVAVLNPDSLPSIYDFLPYKEWISSSYKENNWEVGIIVDSSEYERLKKVQRFFSSLSFVINIDHHISNKKFGDLNFLDSSASSAGEMVYEIFKTLGERPTKEEALLLYVAILTDTNCFKFSTTAHTHYVVSELLSFGLNPRELQEKIYDIPFLTVKLLGLIFSTLQISKSRKVVWVEITREMLESIDKGRSGEITQTDVFINQIISIKNIKVAALFKELDNKIKISLRSKDSVDVNKIAKVFGGGGHLRASGCLIQGALKEVEERVIGEIEKEIGDKVGSKQ